MDLQIDLLKKICEKLDSIDQHLYELEYDVNQIKSTSEISSSTLGSIENKTDEIRYTVNSIKTNL
ncbi:hypothetical protein [Clostridium cadaveris]|uniref:hypothetical protein n=1 Tax=Clostridium cadaveris TaxID=1529 RepID=UPI000C0799DA|nr:hypothetical protein [Clostridium cadaveris]